MKWRLKGMGEPQLKVEALESLGMGPIHMRAVCLNCGATLLLRLIVGEEFVCLCRNGRYRIASIFPLKIEEVKAEGG